MTKSDRIFVAGHNGLVGSHIVSSLRAKGYENLITRARAELDLSDSTMVAEFFAKKRPDVVFLAAARVGGIVANNEKRADFIYENLQIQSNVIRNSQISGVRRLIFLGSSCIYPKDCIQPISEASLLTGALEMTNRPYAIAKIAGIEFIEALRSQFNLDYISVMPTNLYGPGDNFNLENSHVLPALIRKIVDAKSEGLPHFAVWGTGKPRREFMHARDCAEAIIHLAEVYDRTAAASQAESAGGWSHVNIGTGEDVSIGEVARLLCQIVGYEGEIFYDTSKPDGTFRKLLDVTTLTRLGFRSSVPLERGLAETVEWYCDHIRRGAGAGAGLRL